MPILHLVSVHRGINSFFISNDQHVSLTWSNLHGLTHSLFKTACKSFKTSFLSTHIITLFSLLWVSLDVMTMRLIGMRCVQRVRPYTICYYVVVQTSEWAHLIFCFHRRIHRCHALIILPSRNRLQFDLVEGHVADSTIVFSFFKFNLIIQNKTWRSRYDMIMTIVDL